MLELAMDRAPENRTSDKFGRLHVRVSNICKAAVNPYRGAEIPKHKEMGLDPEKVYMLLRAPEEIAKAAETANNIQVLQGHTPVTAAAPSKEKCVGSTGTDAKWDAPFLTNSLVIWDDEAIAGIESEEEHELSPAYAYEAEMTPGTFEGLHYDGIMRNIVFNHVALVAQGRQGPEVVVGDAQPENDTMSKPVALKSRKALLLHGVLSGALLPLLAQDKKVDVSPLLVDVTAKNYPGKKAAIFAGLKTLTAGKLAQDASLDDVLPLLDKVEDLKDGAPEEADVLGPDQPAVDAEEGEDPMAKVLAFCKGKMGEDDYNELSKLASVGASDDEIDGDPGAPAAPGNSGESAEQAMDAKTIEARVLKRVTEANEARAIVEPVVGKVSMALDSADPIYDLALDHLGIKVPGLNIAGKKALITQHLAGKAATKPATPALAQDAADAEAEFRKEFPNASRIRGRR